MNLNDFMVPFFIFFYFLQLIDKSHKMKFNDFQNLYSAILMNSSEYFGFW